ncbi:hypothetical protein, partial [uncultured Bradyrhizobium sp.]|uniref:ATP-binding protein n=1 Tax=uncultured Bradyrhizobium sp. TaxID=199684 RepID=UPI0034596F63
MEPLVRELVEAPLADADRLEQLLRLVLVELALRPGGDQQDAVALVGLGEGDAHGGAALGGHAVHARAHHLAALHDHEHLVVLAHDQPAHLATADLGEFGKVLDAANLPAPAFGTATTFEGAREVADRVGYPVLVRPSYVLGGRG